MRIIIHKELSGKIIGVANQMKALAIGGAAARGITSVCHVERSRDISCG
jgi:hypothetical protein